MTMKTAGALHKTYKTFQLELSEQRSNDSVGRVTVMANIQCRKIRYAGVSMQQNSTSKQCSFNISRSMS